MRVFRIETKNGKGICAAGTGICQAYHEGSDHKRGCGFDTCFGKDQDIAGINVIMLGWKFAFDSIEKARAWFPLQAGRQAMKEHGAILVEYEIPSFLSMHDVGNHQVIFDYRNAKKVATHDLVTME